jgi:hypothetical protein
VIFSLLRQFLPTTGCAAVDVADAKAGVFPQKYGYLSFESDPNSLFYAANIA